LEKARRGERQVLFVTGEAGIGKTTLTEAFLDRVAATGELWIGRGQCVEHYGASEPYMPLLEALGRLSRALDGERLSAVLRQYAPTWLVHLPALLSPAEREQLQREVQGATPQRMLREMAGAVEALTAERGLILTLEDLHWSDVSSLTWLTFLARRRERARVLGTYRPVEVLGDGHLTRGMTTYRDTGAELVRPYHLALLAEVYRKAERIDEGLTCWPRPWL
jgi:predicted ATPase